MSISVVAVDVGSLANIGWWRSSIDGESTWGRDLDGLVEAVATELRAGVAVALGFEAPLFVPTPAAQSGLNRQRVGDKGRPWCAGAGTGALALGVQQSFYVLAAISEQLRPWVTFDLAELIAGRADLLIWEAFVSGKAKNRLAVDPHVDDARLAVAEFRRRLATATVESDIEDTAVLSLVAAGVLASGLSSDLDLLRAPCLVVAPPPFVTTADAG